MKDFISIRFKVWRQVSNSSNGSYEEFSLEKVSVKISLLEALDQLNEELTTKNIRPITFDHDCREGICGSCGFLVNGQPHGPKKGTTTCQLYMRNFKDNALIILEPWRAKSFPIIQDLSVDRNALDKLIISLELRTVPVGLFGLQININFGFQVAISLLRLLTLPMQI